MKINNFRDLTDVSARNEALPLTKILETFSCKEVLNSASVSKIRLIFFGYFDSERYFQIMKMLYFRGDLTDILAKKTPLVLNYASVAPQLPRYLTAKVSRPHTQSVCS